MGDCIFSLLELATARKPLAGIFAYAEGQRDTYNYLSYGELRSQALKRSQMIRLLPEFETTKVILLHFSDHLDNILWYWAVLYSGKIPAMSTPFPLDDGLRSKHLHHLKNLFENPICLTRADIAVKYPEFSSLNVFYIDEFNLEDTDYMSLIPTLTDTDIAALMLTSGSTGDSKAVCLTHRQILASVRGKASIVDLPEDCTFFNWVGIDHVAGLLETHFEALFLGRDQIHAQANDLIEDPFRFLELINKHRVGRTFAPNFFLANLVKFSASSDKISNTDYDLSCLQCLVSGGEPNPITTCTAVASLFAAYGAPVNAITPGFGMTETCAGCIYSRSCPEFDLSTGMDYASLGHPMPGIEMRVRSSTEVVSNSVEVRLSDSCRGEVGRLQVRGEVVFTSYYNNPKATLEAFTEDGWFDTGDNALIDGSGALHIIGRDKEIIRMYSVSISPSDLESCLDNANIPGATKGFFVCFSHYANGSNERICVVYLPTYLRDDIHARVKAKNAIAKVIMQQTGAYPYILPLDSKFLQRSTIGKLSRGKIKTAFLQGILGKYKKEDEIALWQYQKASTSLPETATEKTLWETISKTLNLTQQESRQVLDLDTAIFQIGISSLELIVLKKRIEEALGLSDLPLITLMTHPTVRSLAAEIDHGQKSRAYQPVVKLQQDGGKTPLWLFHPGVGEVMVFLKLSKHVNDRPVYALRARGFEENEEPFSNIDEAVLTYFNAIKSHQPDGPYALVGYSYGAMLAFETAKLLEQSGEGQQVRFLGSLNLPPHINFRMKQLDWTQCLYNLAYFLDLVSAERSKELTRQLEGSTQVNMVCCFVEAADPSRVTELSLTPEGLAKWVDLASGLSRMACEYEPSGTVPVVDVFHCEPLAEMMCSKEQWLEQHLSRWEDFCATAPRFHAVDGTHYTILNKDNVLSFSRTFQSALQARGL